MSEPTTDILDAETASALFANMVLQQTNMALIFLGKTPNPETGETLQDLDTAKILIDQLEMLAIKTKGNLNSHEAALMKESLAALRMGFVEAVEHAPKISPEAAHKRAAPSQPQAQPEHAAEGTTSPRASAAAEGSSEGESRKKFSKKY